MSQGCTKDRETLQILKEFDIKNKELYTGWIQRTFGKASVEQTQKIAEQLAKEGFDAHTFITEKQLDEATIRAFGRKDRRIFLATKLIAVLEANPGIADMMKTFMMTKIPQSVRMEKAKKGTHVTTGPIDLNLERFPESTLNMFLNKALNTVNMTAVSGRVAGKIGNYSAWFKTPKALKWLDPTGAFEAIASGVRDHASKISSRINLFMSSPRFIPKEGIDKKILANAKVGMETILRKISALDRTSEYPNEYRERNFHRLFAATMKGYTFIGDGVRVIGYDKNNEPIVSEKGKFYIHEYYEPRVEYYDKSSKKWIEFREELGNMQDSEGKRIRAKKYESTGDVMFSFKSPVLMSKYKFPSKKESFYIDMNPKQLENFQKYMQQARAITDVVFEYVVPEMKKSTENLMDGLVEHYESKFGKTRQFNEYAIKQIFFYDNRLVTDKDNDYKKLMSLHPGYKVHTNEEGRHYVDLFEHLNEIERKEVNIVKETFSTTVSDSLIIANHGAFNPDEPEFRKNYWPTIYNPDVFRQMLMELSKSFSDKLSEVKETLANPNITDVQRAVLKRAQDKLESQVKSAQAILDNMDLYHYDNQTGNLMHLSSDNKHFKRISNAYDIRSSRLDEGVFYDYLKNMMGSIERNNLNLKLLESLRRLKTDRLRKKPKITEAEADAIRKAGVNYHRTTYSSTKMVGILGDFESYTRRRNYLRYLWPPNWYRKIKDPTYSITITPEMQARANRLFTVRLSGLFLQNWKSAITNASGAYENIINHGLKMTKNAMNLFIDPEYRQGIRDIIQQSAITEFSDFFSKSMVNGILQMQVESQVSEQILREMILYHKRIGTWSTDEKGRRFKWTKRKSRDKFNEDVVKWLGKSQLWTKAEDLVIRRMGRLKAQERELKSRMKLYAANKLVQWAINKEYAMKPLLRKATLKTPNLWGQWAFLPFGSTAVAMSDLYKAVPLTMSNTESFIRSISFIIGAENAWKNSVNGLRNDIHWSEYKDEQDIDNIIMLGREYSYMNNFGMSIQDVAQAQFGPAQAFGKFKYWQQQKWEADWNKWDEVIMSMQREFDKNGNQVKKFGFKWGKLLPLLYKSTIKPGGNRQNRIASPEVAAYRTMLLSQGLSAYLWNLFMFNPLSLRHFPKHVASTIEAGKALGWRTGISTQLRNFAVTDIMKFIMILPAMATKYALQGAFGGEDELEEVDKTFRYFLSSVPFAGYNVTWAYTFIMALVAKGLDEDDLSAKYWEQVLSVKYGRPQIIPFLNILQEQLKDKTTSAVEAIYDALD